MLRLVIPTIERSLAFKQPFAKSPLCESWLVMFSPSPHESLQDIEIRYAFKMIFEIRISLM